MNLLEDMENPLWKSKNIIYCYVNKINYKKYIGMTIRTLKERHLEHIISSNSKKHGRDYNNPIHLAMNKYRIENFSLEIIHFGESIEELSYFEKFYIKYFNTLVKNGFGYNIATGGNDGFTLAGKTQEEINIWKEKKSKKATGENNPFYGKTHTEEVRKKISDANKKPKSEEHKRKISESNKGKNTGKKRSAETNKKITDKQKVKVVQYDYNMNLIKIWDCIKDASFELNISSGCICACCKGKRKSAGKDKNGNKIIWKYYKEVE